MAQNRDVCIESSLPVVSSNGLNTNKAIDFSGAPSAALPAATTIGGSAVVALANITSTATTGNVFSVTDTGVYTGTGMTALIANSATTGTIEQISGTGLTTGIGLSIVATAATLTTGFYFAANDSALNVITIGSNGHITSNQTTAPTIVVTTQAGITAAAVTAGSTDVCGNITTTGTSTGGTIITLTFNKTYTTAPKAVMVTETNAAAVTGGIFTTATATTAVFTIPVTSGATPSFSYFVIA